MGKDLLQIAEKYGTDKIGHGYIEFYEKLLPKTVQSFLEIGVLKGAGARTFDDFYDNKPEVHLIDLFEEPGNMTEREARLLGYVPHKGSQSDIRFLASINRQFDLITEDASHNSQDQLITFKHAFVNMLNPNGLYVCEDIFCCNQPFYWGGFVRCFEHTILWMLRHYIETGKIINPHFNEGESEMFENIIDRVELCADDKIAFIWKK